MRFVMFLSDAVIPLLVFYILLYGLARKHNVYEEFLEGAKDGFHTVIQILPTLVGLMCAVGVLRASDFWIFWRRCWGGRPAGCIFLPNWCRWRS